MSDMNGKVPLVMIPGTLCTERTFAEQAASLRDVAEPSIQLPAEGSDLRACAAGILGRAPERFVLLGFSLGGLVTLEIMRQAPERVQRLCLLATNPRGSTPNNLETWARWRLEVAGGGFPDIIQAHADGVYCGNPEARAPVTEMACVLGPDTFLRQLDILESRPDSRPSLGAISCPTLLIAGRQDKVTPPELLEEMHGLIPDSRLEILPACGHYAALERSRAVTKLLREWLEA